MASPVSSIRSAARATYSAYKRQPIRWRLAGGSAALTLVILLGFAVIVGTLTTRAIYKDFNRQVSSAADRLQNQLYYQFTGLNANATAAVQVPGELDLDVVAASNARRSASSTGSGDAASTAPRTRRTSAPPRSSSDEESTAGGSRRASSG